MYSRSWLKFALWLLGQLAAPCVVGLAVTAGMVVLALAEPRLCQALSESLWIVGLTLFFIGWLWLATAINTLFGQPGGVGPCNSRGCPHCPCNCP